MGVRDCPRTKQLSSLPCVGEGGGRRARRGPEPSGSRGCVRPGLDRQAQHPQHELGLLLPRREPVRPPQDRSVPQLLCEGLSRRSGSSVISFSVSSKLYLFSHTTYSLHPPLFLLTMINNLKSVLISCFVHSYLVLFRPAQNLYYLRHGAALVLKWSAVVAEPVGREGGLTVPLRIFSSHPTHSFPLSHSQPRPCTNEAAESPPSHQRLKLYCLLAAADFTFSS